MRTARNIFIALLAVADLTICLLTMPMTMVGVLAKYWPFGPSTWYVLLSSYYFTFSTILWLWILSFWQGSCQNHYTVGPRDTRPQAARTLTMHDFELGPKNFEMHFFDHFYFSCMILHDFELLFTIFSFLKLGINIFSIFKVSRGCHNKMESFLKVHSYFYITVLS